MSRSTISREIIRNIDSQGNYRAIYTQKKTNTRSRFKKLGKRKILLNTQLRNYVNSKLELTWSPNQIAKILLVEFKHNISMQVSHEAIYQYIYVYLEVNLKRL